MKRSLKNLAAIGTLAIASLPCWGQASVVTFNTGGTIATGVDELGLFVPAGGVLDGQAFSMSISIDTGRLVPTPTMAQSSDLNDMSSSAGLPAAVTGQVVVAGHSYLWTIDDAEARVILARRGMRGETAPDIASVGGVGTNTRDGAHVSVLGELHSNTFTGAYFVTNTDFNQDITFNTYQNLVLSSSLFHAAMPGPAGSGGPAIALTYFQSQRPLNSAVWTSTSPVPEPGTYGMLIGGLGVLGVAARRKKAAGAARA